MIPFRLTFVPGISLYEQVVYAAKKAIVSGQLRPGDDFPSVRQLSRALKINPNTAHKVVTQLVDEGLLEVRVGAGTVVSRRAASTAADRSNLLNKESNNWPWRPNIWAWISKPSRRPWRATAAPQRRSPRGEDRMNAVLQTVSLTKRFYSAGAPLDFTLAPLALDGLDLEVPESSMYALVGPNGAGKTTAIKILMNLCGPPLGTRWSSAATRARWRPPTSRGSDTFRKTRSCRPG